MTTLSHALRTAAVVSMLASITALPACAQVAAPMPPLAPVQPEPAEAPLAALRFNLASFANGAYLGITPNSRGGASDTLGLLVDDVEAGRPADKAGIKRGARLVSIDGIDLRVDPHDLGDSAAELLPESRLRRHLGTRKAGDAVNLVVLMDGRTETRRVVLEESPGATMLRGLSHGRRVLGINFSERGSMRDTAGLLIVGVTNGGAADKAGLGEGDRIVSIDGVDLRVPAADAGSSDGAQARVSRLRRALDAARDSQPVRLELLSDGRRRTVNVVPTRETGWSINTGDLRMLRNGIRTNIRTNFDMDDDDRAESARDRAESRRERAEEQREAARERAEELREAAQERAEAQREMSRARREQMRASSDRDGTMVISGDDDGGRTRVRGTMRGRTDGATLVIGGLTLAAVDKDFAQQFGRGSEAGALVVRLRGDWDPLQTGDVLLSVEGRSVRDGSQLDVTIDRTRAQRLEILRHGTKETLTLPAAER